jgi:hypothetical protein
MNNDNSTRDVVTVRELYTLVDQKMDQVNKTILRVEGKFDQLESGRLSSLEKTVANMQGRMMMIPMLLSIAFNVFFFIMNYVLFKK